jgi:SAM-dependent methyltransferase
VQTPSLPRAFEPDFYRQNYPEAVGLTDEGALKHYQTLGISKGYMGSPSAERGHLLSFAGGGSILEIGPFHAPSAVGENVRYMDVFDTDELKAVVKAAGHDTSHVPDIHYVAPEGGFGTVDRTFSAVFSGHCIEHQPDLVRHLEGVSGVLEDDGRYYIACPDKRYCFDHYAPETAIVDVLAAYHDKRTRHQSRSFLIQSLSRAHNDPDRHWRHDHGPRQYEGYQNAKTEIFGPIPDSDRYHDTHAWQFTPSSFFQIMSFLYEIGLTDLAPERVYHTRFGTAEFTAALRKGQHTIERDKAFTEPL